MQPLFGCRSSKAHRLLVMQFFWVEKGVKKHTNMHIQHLSNAFKILFICTILGFRKSLKKNLRLSHSRLIKTQTNVCENRLCLTCYCADLVLSLVLWSPPWTFPEFSVSHFSASLMVFTLRQSPPPPPLLYFSPSSSHPLLTASLRYTVIFITFPCGIKTQNSHQMTQRLNWNCRNGGLNNKRC